VKKQTILIIFDMQHPEDSLHQKYINTSFTNYFLHNVGSQELFLYNIQW